MTTNASHKAILHGVKNLFVLNFTTELLNTSRFIHLYKLYQMFCFALKSNPSYSTICCDRYDSFPIISCLAAKSNSTACLFVWVSLSHLPYQWEKADLCSNPSYRLHPSFLSQLLLSVFLLPGHSSCLSHRGNYKYINYGSHLFIFKLFGVVYFWDNCEG